MTDRLKLSLALRAKCSHKGKCPVEDQCPVCNRPVYAHDAVWKLPWIQTTQGLVATGNYCRDDDCEEWAQQWPEEVANVLRKRKTVGAEA